MEKETAQKIIESYIEAYNNFDIDGMIRHVHPDIAFKNFVDGEVTHSILGIEGFKLQAKEATQYFENRKQIITQLDLQSNRAEVWVDYTGTLAVDLPNGLNAGEKLELKGKSIFVFEEDKIISIEDYS